MPKIQEAISIIDVINNYISTHFAFTTGEFTEMLREVFPEIGRSTVYKILKELCREKRITRVGRGHFTVDTAKCDYTYELSDTAKEIASAIIARYPLVDFQIWEAYQWNEFINFLFARNTVFVEVEGMAEEAVFRLLFERYAHVLLHPSFDEYDKYAGAETVVVGKLVTEAPPCYGKYKQAPLEKLLVDLFGHGLSGGFIARSEYAAIYEESFRKYTVNRVKMFRYARRRGIEKDIQEFIRQQTNGKEEKEV